MFSNLMKLADFRKRRTQRSKIALGVETLEDRLTPATPTITAIAPASGPTTGGTTVTITGTDLSGATAVDFGGVAGTIVSGTDTATQIMVTAPPSANGAGLINVTLTNSDGTSATNSADQFTYVSPVVPSPQLSIIEGNVAYADGAVVCGVTITLSGTTLSGNAVNLTTQTDASGNYVFNQVQAGSYTITRGSTDSYQGGSGVIGNLGGTPGGLSIGNLTVQSGQAALGYDFTVGFVSFSKINLGAFLSSTPSDFFTSLLPAGSGKNTADGSDNPDSGQSFGNGSAANLNSISGSVQNFSNTNGVPGVQLILTGIDYTGTVITPIVTSTNSSGDFTFSGLNPGTYTVQIEVPSGEQAAGIEVGPQGGFTQFGTQVYGIDVPSSTSGQTYSGYVFQIASMSATANGGAPVLRAGLVDTNASTTPTVADPAIQGTVSTGSDGSPVSSLLVSVNGSAQSDVTSSLVNGSFYLNEATLAQAAGEANGVLPDGTYNVTIEAVDSAGNATVITLPQFTLKTAAPAVPILTVQTTSGSVLNSQSTSLGSLINTVGGVVITNPNNVVPSGTNPQTITLTGTTSAGATVSLFAGSNTSVTSATADINGNFSLTVTLTQAVTDYIIQSTNAAGVSSYSSMFIVLEQPLTTTTYSATASPDPLTVNVDPGGTSAVLNLADGFNDPNAGNVIVQLDTSSGPVDIELFAGQTPQTVDNFLAYIESNQYNQAIFSRLVSDFVLQGGEYQLQTNPTSLATISPLSTINSEVGISSNPNSSTGDNLAGTLAFALPSQSGSSSAYDENGATDQFFFNLSNNSTTGSTSGNNLDANFAVFGQVLSGADMRVINTLASASTQDQSTSKSDLTNIPLTNYTGTNFPADASASNFEVINQATVLSQSDQLTYSVQVNDPSGILKGDSANSSSSFTALSAANGTINANDTLSLNLNANVTGTVTFQVTATDLAGGTATQTFTLTVGKTVTTPSAATVASSTNSQAVSLSATVDNPDGSTVGEGTVTFTILNPSDNNAVVGTAVSGTVSSGSASATYTLPAGLAAGSYTIQAVYTDTSNTNSADDFLTSTGTSTLTVTAS